MRGFITSSRQVAPHLRVGVGQSVPIGRRSRGPGFIRGWHVAVAVPVTAGLALFPTVFGVGIGWLLLAAIPLAIVAGVVKAIVEGVTPIVQGIRDANREMAAAEAAAAAPPEDARS